MTTITILPSDIRDDEKQTQLLTHLPKQMGKIHDAAYYGRQKKKIKLEKYTPQNMPVPQPSITDIEAEIRELGSHYDNKQSASQVLAERTTVWQELYALHSRIEAEKESLENNKYQAQYNAAIVDLDDIVNGEESVVDTALQSAIQQLQLPFELTVNLDYDKMGGNASITSMMPLSYCIPTTKTVFHSRGVTVKNKLQRELQQEESECIVGLAFLLVGQTFSVSPNIKCANLLFYQYRSKEALLAIHFDRDKFVANIDKMDTPSVALYDFQFAANIRTVREAMVLSPMPERDLQSFLISTNQRP